MEVIFLIFSFLVLGNCDRQVRQADDDEAGAPCSTLEGIRGTCTTSARCQFFFDDISRLTRSTCPLAEGSGICCPLDRPQRNQPPVEIRPPTDSSVRQASVPQLSVSQLNNAIEHAEDLLRFQDQLEDFLLENGITTPQESKEAKHQFFVRTFDEAIPLGRGAKVNNDASKDIVNNFNLTAEQGRSGLTQFSVLPTRLSGTCPPRPSCFNSKYRTVDGSCNNLNNPLWGKSFRAHQRLLAPRYADGISTPRVASDGSNLTSARIISLTAITDINRPDSIYSLMLMQWGQFLDHDLTLTPIHKGKNNTGIVCCHGEVAQDPSLRHPECFVIDLPSNDPFYAQFQEVCMEFVRSLPAPRPDCNFGPREQMNELTSFIDGSMVYGSTQEASNVLRTFVGGKLRVTRNNGRDLLPFDFEDKTCSRRQVCFKAGDERVSEQAQLATMHTIWLREHNRIAEQLAELNPNWNDETLYQETRRIVGAEIQQITYKEFLPLVLGPRAMETFGINLQTDRFTFDYDPNLNPTVLNEFAAAAYRFGHSLIQGAMQLFNQNGQNDETLSLSQNFFRPVQIQTPGYIDKFLRGLTRQGSQSFDNALTREITQHLFQGRGRFGLDLASLNIQRGRDHGLPAYNDYRAFCSLPRARVFEDLLNHMDFRSVRALQQVYRNVDDIDLWVAGLLERPLPDAAVGPTFACIISEQFKRLKKGDRFWFENGNHPHSFTEDQLKQIRRVTLARIICDNSDELREIQPLVMVQVAVWNPLVDCDGRQIPHMNLDFWRNERVK